MGLIDRIKQRFFKRQEEQQQPAPHWRFHGSTEDWGTIQKRIMDNPTAYNRATRRAFGLRGRAVPLADFPPEIETFVPRFVRRHFGQKRARPKIVRMMKRYGLV